MDNTRYEYIFKKIDETVAGYDAYKLAEYEAYKALDHELATGGLHKAAKLTVALREAQDDRTIPPRAA